MKNVNSIREKHSTTCCRSGGTKPKGAYNCTYLLAPRQPEKDIPRLPSAAERQLPMFEHADV